jgi:hypothetical protein
MDYTLFKVREHYLIFYLKGAVPFLFKVPICDLLSFNIGWHSS